jgi:hypothetical protein
MNPPPVGHHHAIYLARYGSEAGGWEPRLALSMAGPNKVLFIDDGDLAKPIDVLVRECVSVLATVPTKADASP